MIRDLSGTAWVAPGITQMGLNLVQTQFANNPVPTDEFQNSFSPIQVDTITLSQASPTPIPVPNQTHVRMVYVQLPRNNQAAVSFRWNNADMGKYVNPQGFFAESFDPNHVPNSLYYTAAADVAGVSVYWG